MYFYWSDLTRTVHQIIDEDVMIWIVTNKPGAIVFEAELVSELEGVWVTYYYDYFAHIDRVHKDEESMCAYLAEHPRYKHIFLPFGKDLDEVLAVSKRPLIEKDL